jgi:aminopeptidase N
MTSAHACITKTMRTIIISSLLMLTSCTSIAPLDPIIGDTGKRFSSVALTTDVISYHIDLEIIPSSQSIVGSGGAEFLIVSATSQVELKLDQRFDISKIEINEQAASYLKAGGILTINLPKQALIGDIVKATVYYSGKPHVALLPPWSGGFVWDKTPSGEDWIATAVQGEGCDLFWPCKDHFADKAEKTQIHLTVPSNLVAVTNGVLQNTVQLKENRTRYEWLMNVPASDYNIALNIGPYAYIKTQYTSVNGVEIPIEFWPLKENEAKARTLIQDDLLDQIAFFESHIGPYPWGKEKLGFVETPHLGMEHQTVNAYGKKYVRDKHGFDWLLHHELAHEWFGNLMTHKTINDAWLHEGFGLYMQPAYSLYMFGEAAYQHRMYESYLGLLNCKAIVLEGEITSDQAFNSDIYGKGGWALHTLRWLIGEAQFWQATRKLVHGQATNTQSLRYPMQTRYRSTQDFVDIVNTITGQDYTWLFDVYLKQAELPILDLVKTSNEVNLKWKAPNNMPFPMPIPVSIDGKLHIVKVPSEGAKLMINTNSHVLIDPQMKILRQLPIIGNCEENLAKRKRRK